MCRLNEIEIPALFTCGRFDEATPEACLETVREWLNRQELRPGA